MMHPHPVKLYMGKWTYMPLPVLPNTFTEERLNINTTNVLIIERYKTHCLGVTKRAKINWIFLILQI